MKIFWLQVLVVAAILTCLRPYVCEMTKTNQREKERNSSTSSILDKKKQISPAKQLSVEDIRAFFEHKDDYGKSAISLKLKGGKAPRKEVTTYLKKEASQRSCLQHPTSFNQQYSQGKVRSSRSRSSRQANSDMKVRKLKTGESGKQTSAVGKSNFKAGKQNCEVFSTPPATPERNWTIREQYFTPPISPLKIK